MQPLFEKLLDVTPKSSEISSTQKAAGYRRRRLATFLASASASAVGVRLLNSHAAGGPAGRTLDLTLFAVVRALDVVIGEIWERWKNPRVRSGTFTRLESSIGRKADAAVFAASATIITFYWIYEPERLP